MSGRVIALIMFKQCRYLCCAWLACTATASAEAVESPKPPSSEERQELPPSAIIEELKRRAQAIIERRDAGRPRLSGYTSLIGAYESNPNLSTPRKGDWYTEQDAGFSVRWRATDQLWPEVGYRFAHVYYSELRDNNYLSNTFYTTWRWFPTPRWRWESSWETEWLEYPETKSSSLTGGKFLVSARYAITTRLYHQLGWHVIMREYASRKARRGNSLPTDNAREDRRHTLFYEIGGTWRETLIRLRQEAYLHTSNDAYQDFYDAEDYKIRLSTTRQFAKRWNGYASVSYERKNYRDRVATTVAEYDDLYTVFGSISYALTKQTSIGYSFTRKKLDSNYPAYEYTDGIHQLTLSAYF